MKRFYFILCGIFLILQMGKAQVFTIAKEDFDGVITFSVTNSLSASWSSENTYSVSAPNSYHGVVPTSEGDSIILTSPIYDFSGYENVRLSFDQICKVPSSDVARIEYRLDQMGQAGAWKVIPTSSYTGSGKFDNGKFSSSSYAIWDSTNNLSVPASSWWQSESFDLSNQVGFERAQFRFIIKKGNVAGSNFAYGWLLDNFKVEASIWHIAPPTICFVAPSIYGRQIYTGPFSVYVKMESNTDAALIVPQYLQLKLTYGNTISYDSVPLSLVSGSTYTANLGSYLIGTRIDYKVSASDTYGNNASDSSYIIVDREGKHFYWEDTTSTLTNLSLPYDEDYTYSWSRVLYLASELRSGNITHLAWKCATDNTVTDSVYVYLKQTSATSIDNATGAGDYADPSLSGAILVYAGPLTSKIGWVDLFLNNPFTLLPDSNLIVYTAVTKNTTQTSTSWYYNNLSDRVRFGHSNTSLAMAQSTTSNNVPLIRLSFALDSNDVLLTNIGPDYVMGGSTPVQAMIQNLGLNNLTSAIISWSINGVQQSDYHWNGNLAEGFRDTITLGSYMPSVRSFDTISVWVHTPNGVTNDTSTLTKSIFGCNGANPISGVFTIGSDASNDFSSVAAALNSFAACGISGDVELALTDSLIEQQWDFSNVGANWGNYQLIIRSAANNADSTILRVNAGTGAAYAVTFNNSSNITLKHLTIDASGKAYTNAKTYYTAPIIFTGSASNIHISQCKLLGKDTTNANYKVVNMAVNIGRLSNVRFNHNILQGGYDGFFLNAGSLTDTGLVYIDSNVINGTYRSAIYLYYANPYVRGNECYQRSAAASPWYGIWLRYGGYGEVCNNKIKSYNKSGRTEGINLGALGRANTPILVANNEIMAYSIASDNGIATNTGTCHIDFINNSIHCESGSIGMRGIQVHNDAHSHFTIRNNNIFIIGNNSYPLYLNGTIANQCDIANNNQWSSVSNLASVNGVDIKTEAEWLAVIPTEEKVTSILPNWADSTISLNLNSFAGLDCPRWTSVKRDKNGNIRLFSTTRGAYNKPLDNLDLALMEIQYV